MFLGVLRGFSGLLGFLLFFGGGVQGFRGFGVWAFSVWC